MKPPKLPTPPLVLRGRSPELVPFVTSSWMHCGKGADGYLGIPHEVYAHHHHATIERLWNDPGATWLFAAYESDPNFVFGWLLGEATDQGPVLHFVYTRKSMRGTGVARTLLHAFLDGQVAKPREAGVGDPRPLAYHTMQTSHWRHAVRGSETLKQWWWLWDPWLLDQQPFHRGRGRS